MKKMNKKGFTLAELLIVVAIIAVLVAIAIPVFTSQLEKSKIATDEANARSAYGEAVAGYLSDEITDGDTITLGKCTYTVSINVDDDEVSVSTSANLQSQKYAAGITYDGSDFTAATTTNP